MIATIRGYVSLTALFFCAAELHAGGLSSSVDRYTLTPNAEQFFDQGTVLEDNVIFGLTTPIVGLPNDFDTPDTLLATFPTSDLSVQITINDDSDADTNPPLLDDAFSSLFRIQAPFDDDITVGVTGSGNPFFDGTPHSESGDYYLTVGQIDPSTLGGDFADSDGTNETLAGADVLSLGVNQAQVAVNTLLDNGINNPGDVDFYRVDLNAGDILNVMTAPLDDLPIGFGLPDTLIVFFDDEGNILFDDDEAGDDFSDFTDFLGPHDGQGSALHFLAPESGTYYFAVTADDDELAEGDHIDFGHYGLLVSRVNPIPEPGSLALLAMGGLFLGYRRRA